MNKHDPGRQVFPDGSVNTESTAMQHMGVWSLGWDNPLEEEMAIYSSILAWKIPWSKLGRATVHDDTTFPIPRLIRVRRKRDKTYKKNPETLKWYMNVKHYCCCYCSVTKSCLTLLWPHWLEPTRLLCPWDFQGKNTGVDCHFFFQEIFLSQGSNQCLLNWQAYSLPLKHQGSPKHYYMFSISGNKEVFSM